jgi:[ribosomal protein S18]-alanine N-acetyltransferase
LRLVVEAMELEDIPQVLEVDRESYSLPWPASAYRREILHNRNARYFVLRETDHVPLDGDPSHDDRPRFPFGFFRRPTRSEDAAPERTGTVVGYAGMWLMLDEAHITTIAMRTDWRGKGLGELLLASLLETAFDVGAHRVTLEVRVSNEPAQNLYRKYGFSQEGVRPRYYSDNNEDAYIMTTSNIRDHGYRATFEELVRALRARFAADAELAVHAPAMLAVKDAGKP